MSDILKRAAIGAALGGTAVAALTGAAGIGIVGSFGAIGLGALELISIGGTAGAVAGAKSAKPKKAQPRKPSRTPQDIHREKVQAAYRARQAKAQEPEMTSQEIIDLQRGIL